MSQVDPFIVQIPASLRKDRESEQFFIYLNRFLHDLWQCTTGGTGVPTVPNSDLSNSNLHNINFLLGRVYDLGAKIEDLERQKEINITYRDEFNSITVSESLTINDFDFANVMNGSTVTLPQYPVKNSVIIIRNGDGKKVKMDGNGKKINGSSTGYLYRKGTAITLQYFIDSDEWLAR